MEWKWWRIDGEKANVNESEEKQKWTKEREI